nr:odorant-binding protein 9 [Leptocybe invasa]
MKTIAIVLAVCLAFVYADDPLKDVPKDLIKTCLTENGFDAAQYPNGLRNVKVPDNQEKNRDCYYACMMKKMNLMKPDGMLLEDNLKTKFNLNLETLQKAMNTCKGQVKGNDSCKLAACLMANRGI